MEEPAWGFDRLEGGLGKDEGDLENCATSDEMLAGGAKEGARGEYGSASGRCGCWVASQRETSGRWILAIGPPRSQN